ncbi:MAG: MHYT domain-containing protein [Streptosporangiaceae bacterium]
MLHVDNFSYGALNPVLAYLASCMGCFIGLRCMTRARAAAGRERARWLVLGALAIATTGIWVMHFVAMLGFTIPGQTIRYSVPITILSMLIAVIVVGIGTFIVGFSREGIRPLLLGGLIIGLGVASMHYIGMAGLRIPDSVSYNPVLVAGSVVIAVIAGTAALWAALRLDTVWSTLVASMIMGVAVSAMHYTGMVALQVRAAPGLAVSSTATASAEAFLVPLILGISMIGFIFSAVIALSPSAAEMCAEAELMERITSRSHFDPYGLTDRRAAPNGSGPAHQSQPGSLFSNRRPAGQAEEP